MVDDPHSFFWRHSMIRHLAEAKKHPNIDANDSRAGAKWKQSSAKWRQQLDMSKSYRPWTGRDDFEGKGIPHTPRILDLLDCVTAQKCKHVAKDASSIKTAMEGVFVDISQSHDRKCFSTTQGVLPTMTTGTMLYSFSRDSVVTPLEMFLLQGHGRQTTIPDKMTDSDLRRLSGEGMAVPSLAAVIWSIHMTKQFP